MHGIRKGFKNMNPEGVYILFQEECYFINPEIVVRLDVTEFLSLWKQGLALEARDMEAALACYKQALAFFKGDFLEEYRYEYWVNQEREYLAEVYVMLLDKLSKLLQKCKQAQRRNSIL